MGQQRGVRWLVPGLLALFPSTLFPPAASAATFSEAQILLLHNQERARWKVAPLQWDEGLARAASQYASELASSGNWRHSAGLSAEQEGENLWMGTRGAFRPAEMVGKWLSQRSLFVPGRFPQVSRTGKWSDVGHYSQIVWRGTTHVGCAVRSSASYDYLVCRYGPAGNVMGRGVL